MKRILNSSVTFGIILLALFLVGRAFLGPSEAPTPSALATPMTLEAAIASAAEQDKIVFAVATASWCGPCQTYKRTTLADERVQAWLDHNAVGIMIDVDQDKEDAGRLQVRSMPSTYIIKDGTIVTTFTGVVSKKRLMEALEPLSIASAD